MLTGKVPYDAESPVTVAIKHIQEPVVPPIQLNGNIPVSLNKLVLKAIEKDPNNRYQSAKEMLIDLTRIQKDISYDIFPINAQDDFTRIMTPLSINDEETDDMDTNKGLNRRTKKILILTLSAILVIVLGAVLGWAFSMKNNDSQQTPPVTTEKPSINVPNVIGKSEQDAKGIVEALGLKFEVTSSEPSDQPVGTIISTSPVADTKVEKNSEVRATRSIGLAVAKIPNLIDIDIASAKEIIVPTG